MIPILGQAIRVMEVVGDGEAVNARELGRRLGISGTSAYRIVKTFEAAGWVEQGERGLVVGNGMLRVVRGLVGRARWLERLRGVAEGLARETGLTAVVSVREGMWGVVVERALPGKRVGVAVPVGERVPLVRAMGGACLLADATVGELAGIAAGVKKREWVESEEAWRERIGKVRKAGWGVDPGVYHARLAVVSAVVRGGEGVAAVSLVGLPGEVTVRGAGRFGRVLVRAVEGLGRQVVTS